MNGSSVRAQVEKETKNYSDMSSGQCLSRERTLDQPQTICTLLFTVLTAYVYVELFISRNPQMTSH